MNLGWLLFSFNGRANRGKFWLAILLQMILLAVVAGLVFAFVPMDDLILKGADGQPVVDEAGVMQFNTSSPQFAKVMAIYGVAWLAALWMSFANMVKRCHDRGKSGWWSLIALIPLAGFIWMLIDLGIMEGDPGPNKYGPNPLAAA